jgi:hypothetical protein
MVSVAMWDAERREKVHRELWTKREREAVKRVARDALEAVGERATDAWEDSGSILCLRRQCRDEERRQVVEKYLAR